VAGLTFSTNIACLHLSCTLVNDADKVINLEGGARDLSSKIAACKVRYSSRKVSCWSVAR